MKKKLKKNFSGKFKVANDMVLTMGATIVMQIALQIILYPVLNKYFGEDVTGVIIYFMGIVYIFPQAIGVALCNTRLISRKTADTTNADFSKLLIVSCIICSVLCFYIGYSERKDILFSILFALFSILYAVRMYSLVDFRLRLDFRGYFICHLIVSIGYLIGMGLYFLCHQWLVIFFVGEGLGLLYEIIKGNIFKKDKPTGNIKKNIKDYVLLLLSILLRDGVNQYDKVVIFAIISSELVTQYNALSLIGKSMQMLINPVNTLIITYLSAKKSRLTKAKFKKFTLICLLSGVVFLLVCQIATPIYIRLFYSSFYETVMEYCLIVNCGLIIGFVASLFMATIMSQGQATLYTVIQIIWGIIYTVFAYVFTKKYSIMGLAFVSICVNSLKLIAAIIIARLKCVCDNN